MGRDRANPRTMLLIGRITMIVATAAGLYFATSRFNILDLLVFVGALWGCLVFPVIASFSWGKVNNAAFGFFGLRVGKVVGVVATLVALPVTVFGIGWGDRLSDHQVLSASLVAYAVSFLVCYAMSVQSGQDFDFDFDSIQHVTGDFDPETLEAVMTGAELTAPRSDTDDDLDPSTEGRLT